MSILTRIGSTIDRGAARLMERRMAARPARIHGDARDRLLAVTRAYSGVDLFAAPARPARIHEVVAGDGPHGTRAIDLTWASEYAPGVPAARALYDETAVNHTAHARLWTSGRAIARPVIVMIHGWAGGNPAMTALTFDVSYWIKHGYDVAAFTLPYHGVRAPGTSGALFPSPNPLRTNEGFGQAIHDLRALALELRARGATAIGALGMSLGGYTTALWATIPASSGSLDFAVAMIPAVNFARLMWSHGAENAQRRRAEQAGISEDLLEDAFALHMPTRRPVALDRDRLAIIAGRGDRITPPDHAIELAAHWGVDIEWFDGGHLAQLGRGDAIRNVRKKLAALDLPGRAYRG